MRSSENVMRWSLTVTSFNSSNKNNKQINLGSKRFWKGLTALRNWLFSGQICCSKQDTQSFFSLKKNQKIGVWKRKLLFYFLGEVRLERSGGPVKARSDVLPQKFGVCLQTFTNWLAIRSVLRNSRWRSVALEVQTWPRHTVKTWRVTVFHQVLILCFLCHELDEHVSFEKIKRTSF